MNEYYVHNGYPVQGSAGASASLRGELDSVMAGFDKLPALTGNGSKAVVINPGGTGLTVTTGTLALAGNLATTGAFNTTLAQQASTTITLPTTDSTMARTDAGQTFTGTQVFLNAVAIRDTTAAFNVSLTMTSTSATITAGRALTIDVGNVAHTLALGTTAGTITFPNTAAMTVARIDAGQTFTGVQAMTSPDITTSITTTSVTFTAFAGATTLMTIGGTGASASSFFPSTLDATSSITGAIRTSGGISAAKAANFGTTLSVGGASTLSGHTAIVGDSDFVGTGIAQFEVRGSTDGNKKLYVGYDTTLNKGMIQSEQFGTSVTSLRLNPLGGAVEIGAALVYGGVTLTAAVTGTGKMVLDTSPVLVTPTLGVATATSINFGGGALSVYVPKTAWTPVIAFGGASTGVTYSTQVGNYTKVGDQVVANFTIILTSNGSSTGTVTITGLPFSAATQNAVAIAGSGPTFSGTLIGILVGNLIVLYSWPETGTAVALTEANIPDTAQIQGHVAFNV